MPEKLKKLLVLFKPKRQGLLLLLVIFGLFFVVQPSQAIIGTGLFDYAMSAMSGLADLGGWTFAIFFVLFLGVGLSTALVGVSASLLEWSMGLHVNVVSNPLVQSGWDFTLGLANLFFILIFVYIALAFILRLDTLKMKQALPNLIIIALVINFSLLLIGVFVDSATFFQNTILGAIAGEDSVAGATVETLTGGGGNLVSQLISLFVGSMVGLAIPYVDVATMIAKVGLFLAFLPNLVSGFFITLFNSIVGLIFLFYSALFIARIVIIWLLAIFAPLAFLSYILPATRKFFEQWLRTLLSWTFLGVIALFLLMLGLKLMAGVIGNDLLPAHPVSGWGEISDPKYILFYVFFTIYLVVSLVISKKLAPMGTDIVWKYGGMGLAKGGNWVGGKALRFGTKTKTRLDEGLLKKRQELDRKTNRGLPTTRTERLAGWMTRRPGRMELLESQIKGTRAKMLDKEREKILASAPKDLKARDAYLRGELLRQGQRGALRDRDKIASLMDLIADSGKIGAAEEKFVAEAIKHGANEKKILERRPDLAAAAGKTTDDVMRGLDAETFRKQTQKEAFGSADVMKQFLTDQSKFFELSNRGSAETKRAIKESFKRNAGSLNPKNFPPAQMNDVRARIKIMFKDRKWRV